MQDKKTMQKRSILRRVDKPSRYVGGEWQQIDKSREFMQLDRRERLHVAFCFPDLYEIAMSNLAVQILYRAVNAREKHFCERVFMPGPDMRTIMRDENILLESIESGTLIRDFDVLAFSLHYELSYPAMLDILNLSGIPFYAKERNLTLPLVIAGGPIACNLEPIAPFVDIILYGDGENLLPNILERYRQAKLADMGKEEFLRSIAALEGVYIPSFYEAKYDNDGNFIALMRLNDDAAPKVKRHIEKDLDALAFPTDPIVPSQEVVHDRAILELFRGCSRSCRFCQAGYTYRPMRERSPEKLAEYSKKLLESTGTDELSLLSLSSSDYSHRDELMPILLQQTQDCHINLSLPSLRLDSFDFELMEQISGTRKAGLTFAPEAGTQRLRDVINKNISEEDLLSACDTAFRGGWYHIKLYFMLGLPTETDEDILGIADLCHKVLAVWKKVPPELRKKQVKIVASIAFFMPKPWTAFQWCEQISQEQMQEKIDLLSENLRDRRISMQWHDFETSRIEAVLARGDRRLAPVLEKVWQKGAFLDAWDEYFSAKRWDEALAACSLSSKDYTRARSTAEPLPWDHMDARVDKSFLLREYKRALQGKTTSPCLERCNACGLEKENCGICLKWQNKTVKRESEKDKEQELVKLKKLAEKKEIDKDKVRVTPDSPFSVESYKLRLFYERKGSTSCLAHLDMMRIFERALMRAKWPLRWSEHAYNPRPLIVFALPVGCFIETRNEIFEIELEEKIDIEAAVKELNSKLPAGISINDAYYVGNEYYYDEDNNLRKRPSLMALVEAAEYEFIGEGIGRAYAEVFKNSTEPIITKRQRKKKIQTINISELIISTEEVKDNSLRLITKAGSRANMRPDMFLQSLVERHALTRERANSMRIIRHRLILSDEDD